MTPSLLSNHSSWCQTSSWNTIQTSHFIPSQPYENKQEEMNEPLLLMEYHVYRTEHVAFLISYWKMHFKSAFTISIGCSVQEVMNRHLTITLSALLNICLPRLTIYYKVVYKSLKVSKFTAGSEQMTHLCSSQALACSQTPGWCRLGPRPRYSLPSPCLLVVWTNAFSTTWCWGERLVLSTEFGHPLIGQAPPLGGVDTSKCSFLLPSFLCLFLSLAALHQPPAVGLQVSVLFVFEYLALQLRLARDKLITDMMTPWCTIIT